MATRAELEKRSFDLLASGLNWAESVITILGEDLNFDKTQAIKMATPFGGGVARWGTICGAVVGGSMGLGFCFGTTRGEDKESRDKTYAKVQQIIQDFEKEFGTIQCKDLIHLNLRDPADRKKFMEMNLRQRCAQFVARNVENVRKLLKEK